MNASEGTEQIIAGLLEAACQIRMLTMPIIPDVIVFVGQLKKHEQTGGT